jgi:molybdenum cofactor biosynthesis protein B
MSPDAVTLSAGGELREDLPFKPVRIAVVTVSDTRTLDTDTSGALLAKRLKADGHLLADRLVVKDDVEQIRAVVRRLVDNKAADVILTTGGTGLTGRDVTPEAIEPLLDKRMEGFSTIFHLVSYEMVGLSTLQSRALAGLIKGVIVFCMPGSNGACKDGWDKIIRWQLDSRHMPCNMVELMPRFNEHLTHDCA